MDFDRGLIVRNSAIDLRILRDEVFLGTIPRICRLVGGLLVAKSNERIRETHRKSAARGVYGSRAGKPGRLH